MRVATFGRAAVALCLSAPLLCAEENSPNAAANLPDKAATGQILAILDAGAARGDAGVRDAQRHADAARQAPSHDPRVDYAFGLVLLEHANPQAAGEAFLAALEMEHLAYLPAWQAGIRLRLLRKEPEAGLELLERLAAKLADPATSWSSPQSRADGAYWVGRVIAACQLAELNVKSGPEPRELGDSLAKSFEPALQEAYARGAASVQEQHDELSGELDRTELHVARMQKDRQQRRQSTIERQQQQLADKAQTTEMTGQELKAWRDEQLRRIDRAIASQQKSYDALTATDAEVAGGMLELRRDLTGAKFAEQAGLQGENGAPAVPLSLRIEEKLTEMQKQRIKLSAQAQAVSEQIAALKAEREATNERYHAATGDLTQDEAGTQKSKKALERATRQNKTTTAKAGRAMQARKQRLTQLATYLGVSTSEAKLVLIEELGQSP